MDGRSANGSDTLRRARSVIPNVLFIKHHLMNALWGGVRTLSRWCIWRKHPFFGRKIRENSVWHRNVNKGDATTQQSRVKIISDGGCCNAMRSLLSARCRPARPSIA